MPRRALMEYTKIHEIRWGFLRKLLTDYINVHINIKRSNRKKITRDN